MRKAEEQLICADMFSEQRVLIVGLGKTGLSCAKFLADRNVDFAVMDSRVQPPGIYEMKSDYPDVSLYMGSLDQNLINDFDVLIVSPGVALKENALRFAAMSGKPIIGDVEILAQCTDKPIVAITGSNGKSTVTTLVGEMAKHARKNAVVAGNIGVPVLNNINQDGKVDLYILELSSFQLETTQSLNTVASTILNISEDHMDRYPSLSEYAQTKRKILSGKGTVIVNLDDEYLMSLIKDDIHSRNVIGFTLLEPTTDDQFGLKNLEGTIWLARGNKVLLPVNNLKIKGRHNIANVLAALALGTALDLPIQVMLETIQQFTGLPHRTQWILESAGVQWINDSKATNVGAAMAAINGLESDNLIIILGGQGKDQDFTDLGEVVQRKAKLVILMGEDADLIAESISPGVKIQKVTSLREAVDVAHDNATSGDIVLLSPACASFDMFDGYEHRGDEFMRLAREVVS
jgi:UDP-N-acetylmuramoylalanine--D-glutamate ligase